MPRRSRRGRYKTNRFERYPKTVSFLILVPFVFILDIGMTGGYHLFKYGTIHKNAPREALRQPSPVFHHTLKPNGQQATQKWGHVSYPLFTNSLGFKDRAVREVPLHTSQFRLLFIGDSFTEGIGYPYEQTFVGIVDDRLKASNVEILNAAVASYSPAIYFKKIEYLLETVELQFDHLIVFMDISDIADEMMNYRIRDGRVVWIGETEWEIKELVFEYTGLLKNLWIGYEKIHQYFTDDRETRRTEEDRRYATNRYRGLWTINEEAFSQYGFGGIQKAREHMDLLYSLLQKHQIGMTVVVYPWPDQILHRDLHSRQVEVWKDWSARHAVTFLNFFPLFIQTDSDPKTIISEYFIEGDIHWNEKGHQRMAQYLLEQLRSQKPALFQKNSLQ